MQIFLTYASEQKAVAEAIAFSLRGRGHKVFLDKDDLPPGKSYDEQIEEGIAKSDYLLFLISPQSIQPGRYTLTELEHARRKWRSPDGYILPVVVEPTDLKLVPEFLRAVTLLEPKGNIAAEVAAHVKETDKIATRNLIAYFSGAGVLSGFLSVYLGISGQILPNLTVPGGDSIYPGLWFGLVLAILFVWKVRASLQGAVLLALSVQVAWQLAMLVHGAASADIHRPELAPRASMEWVTPAHAQAAGETQDPADAEMATTTDIPQSMLARFVPVVLAGAIGAFGTWLGSVFCYRRLLTIDAAVVTTIVGALGGMLLMLDILVLFVGWQAAVAASIARGITNHR